MTSSKFGGPYTMDYFFIRYLDFPSEFIDWRFFSREQQPIVRYDQQFRVFNNVIWLIVFFTFIIMAMVLKVVHYLYQVKIGLGHGLAGRVTHPLDFLILTLSSLTEPDPLPWFPKFSTGLYCTRIS